MNSYAKWVCVSLAGLALGVGACGAQAPETAHKREFPWPEQRLDDARVVERSAYAASASRATVGALMHDEGVWEKLFFTVLSFSRIDDVKAMFRDDQVRDFVLSANMTRVNWPVLTDDRMSESTKQSAERESREDLPRLIEKRTLLLGRLAIEVHEVGLDAGDARRLLTPRITAAQEVAWWVEAGTSGSEDPGDGINPPDIAMASPEAIAALINAERVWHNYFEMITSRSVFRAVRNFGKDKRTARYLTASEAALAAWDRAMDAGLELDARVAAAEDTRAKLAEAVDARTDMLVGYTLTAHRVGLDEGQVREKYIRPR